MDSEEKLLLGFIIGALLFLFAVVLAPNWRWRRNIDDYTRRGYSQKRVVSSYTTIWVKDPNNQLSK